MQHENRLLEFNGVCSTVRASLVILNNLQDTRTPKAFKNFGRVVLLSALGKVQGMTKELANTHGQSIESFLLLPNHASGFSF